MGVRRVVTMIVVCNVVWHRDRFIRRHHATGLCKGHFDDLNRDVCDLESVMQLVGSVFQKSIVCMTLRHHEVRGQRNL